MENGQQRTGIVPSSSAVAAFPGFERGCPRVRGGSRGPAPAGLGGSVQGEHGLPPSGPFPEPCPRSPRSSGRPGPCRVESSMVNNCSGLSRFGPCLYRQYTKMKAPERGSVQLANEAVLLVNSAFQCEKTCCVSDRCAVTLVGGQVTWLGQVG